MFKLIAQSLLFTLIGIASLSAQNSYQYSSSSTWSYANGSFAPPTWDFSQSMVVPSSTFSVPQWPPNFSSGFGFPVDGFATQGSSSSRFLLQNSTIQLAFWQLRNMGLKNIKISSNARDKILGSKKRISLRLHNKSSKEVLKALADKSGLNFKLSEGEFQLTVKSKDSTEVTWIELDDLFPKRRQPNLFPRLFSFPF